MSKPLLYRYIPPPSVEKYWERLRLLVQENRVPLSRPSGLNDPFDCKTLFSLTDATVDDLREFLESTIARYGGPKGHDLVEAAMQVAAQNPNNAIESLRRRYIEFHTTELDKFGILCFFQTQQERYPKDLLMWAHYADGHRGLCLQFRKDILADNFICKPVNYVDRYPTLKEVAASEGEALADLFLFRKSTRWSYENEWRLLALFEQTNDGLLQLPSAALSGVIFGCNVDPNDRERIIDLTQVRRVAQRFSFFQARKHSEQYRIEIEKDAGRPITP